MIQSKRHYFLTAIFSILGLGFGASTAIASSNEVNLSNVPLYALSANKSNLIMAVDDSGSMEFEVLFSSNNGAAWWQAHAKTFTGFDQNDNPGAGAVNNFNQQGNKNSTWRQYVYLFPNGVQDTTNPGNRYFEDNSGHVALPPLPLYAWARSSEYNKSYFDPAVTYEPWISHSGQTFGQIDATQAPSDPARNGYMFNLIQDMRSDDGNFTFKMYRGMVIPRGTVYYDGTSWGPAASDIQITRFLGVDQGISYFPATFYLPASTPLPTGFGYSSPVIATGMALDGVTPLNGYEIKPSNFSNPSDYEAAINNFANWFSYYRKRHLAVRAGIGHSFADIRNLRVGSFTINNRRPVTMWDLADTVARDAFYRTVYTYGGRRGSTLNKQALKYIGDQFMRRDSNAPIIASCQQNFATLFTDGYALNWDGANVGNADASTLPGSYGGVPPYRDTVSNTIADISMHYYQTNLRDDLTSGEVPIPSACSDASPDPKLDCNADPHMVTFGVVLGQKGHEFGVNIPATNDPYANTPAWPTAGDFVDLGPAAVDDLWHATINGRGAMLNAATPAEVSTAFKSVLNNIAGRLSSAAAVALNTGSISADTKIYQARFNSATWAGELLAFSIDNTDGSIGSELWNAGDLIPQAGTRNIITYNGSSGAAFQWGNLNTTQKAALNTNITGTPDALGENRLAYLRGDDSNEISNGGLFRNRPTSVLGDIINSAPIHVAAPAFRYSDALESAPYSNFRSANAGRTPMVYTGANDGMLHGFDASNGLEQGKEKLAYIPSMVYDNLSRLTSPQYNHTYYVDGTPTVGDAFLGGWKTVLVGGLNAGGQGIYALDVTDPDTFRPTNVLWEFTDPELGYTFSRPNIVKMANGVWAAVFGNGYNNTEADGSASSTGDAVLFIVNLQTGAIIKKISTETGTAEDPLGSSRPNALATVTPIDSNGDAIVDAIYAGDLFGNVWKFDVSDSSNLNNWKSAFGTAATPTPLFTACAVDTVPCPAVSVQPITSRMDVGRGPQGQGTMVYFGTGKYVESSDTTDLSTQTFYGILDKGVPIASRGNLLKQEILFEGFTTTQNGTSPPFEVRVTTDKSMTTESGWYLDLTSPNLGAEGERVVSDPILNAGRIIFTTLIPDTAVCSFGGQGWLMELDALSGSRLAYTPFDLTDDGRFTEDDLVLHDGTAVAVSGKKDNQILSTPGILNDGEREFKYISGSSGNVNVTVESTQAPQLGRQSWQQLK